MSQRLLNLLSDELQGKLEKEYFKLIKEEKSESFDNELLVYESPTLQLRVVRDRGDISVQISKEENQWFELEEVIKLIDKNKSVKPRLNELIQVFLNHHEAIIFLLEKDQKKQTIEKLKKSRIEANRKFLESRDN